MVWTLHLCPGPLPTHARLLQRGVAGDSFVDVGTVRTSSPAISSGAVSEGAE